jgi:hypothetical protein
MPRVMLTQCLMVVTESFIFVSNHRMCGLWRPWTENSLAGGAYHLNLTHDATMVALTDFILEFSRALEVFY